MNSTAGEPLWSDEPDDVDPVARVLPTVRSAAVGGLSRPSYCDQVGWPLEVDHCRASLYPAGVPALSCGLPSRRRRALGAAARRIWPGGDSLDWPLAFS